MDSVRLKKYISKYKSDYNENKIKVGYEQGFIDGVELILSIRLSKKPGTVALDQSIENMFDNFLKERI